MSWLPVHGPRKPAHLITKGLGGRPWQQQRIVKVDETDAGGNLDSVQYEVWLQEQSKWTHELYDMYSPTAIEARFAYYDDEPMSTRGSESTPDDESSSVGAILAARRAAAEVETAQIAAKADGVRIAERIRAEELSVRAVDLARPPWVKTGADRALVESWAIEQMKLAAKDREARREARRRQRAGYSAITPTELPPPPTPSQLYRETVLAAVRASPCSSEPPEIPSKVCSSTHEVPADNDGAWRNHGAAIIRRDGDPLMARPRGILPYHPRLVALSSSAVASLASPTTSSSTAPSLLFDRGHESPPHRRPATARASCSSVGTTRRRTMVRSSPSHDGFLSGSATILSSAPEPSLALLGGRMVGPGADARYNTFGALLHSVATGAIAPVRGSYVVMQWRSGEALCRRQDLPPEAFWTASELDGLLRSCQVCSNLPFASWCYQYLVSRRVRCFGALSDATSQ